MLPVGDKMKSTLQMFVVKKEREEEYHQEIDNQWKEARSNFFNHAIKQKLIENQIPQKYHIRLAEIFLEAKQNEVYHRLVFQRIKDIELYNYQQQIKALGQSFKFMNEQFSQRQRETPAITQIIQLKLTQLRVISVQYNLTLVYQRQRYEVSAYVLFKVVHENRGLSSVTLKGVLVKCFKEFIGSIAQSRLGQIKEVKSQEWSWMKDFKPSKSLKIDINTEDDFCLTHQREDLCAMKDLWQFGRMFSELSVISILIRLEEYRKLRMERNILQLLQKQLRMLGKLKIKVFGRRGEIADYVFAEVLQMLTSLTTIAQLEFTQIQFSPYQIFTSLNVFLAMEEILSTIFENNEVTHLKIVRCTLFPIFPTITTLQSIELCETYFRRQLNLMSDVAQSNPSLQSIKYLKISQEWRIEEQLLDQLSSLIILQCQNVSLGMLNHSPSNIKSLAVFKSNIGNLNGLSVLFAKLIHISQLSLHSIDFGCQQICAIPSPHLAALSIQSNNEFANKDLEAIDKKWPKLRCLALGGCPNLNESVWSACEFKGLIDLQIDRSILAHGHNLRKQFKRRGVRETSF